MLYDAIYKYLTCAQKMTGNVNVAGRVLIR